MYPMSTGIMPCWYFAYKLSFTLFFSAQFKLANSVGMNNNKELDLLYLSAQINFFLYNKLTY